MLVDFTVANFASFNEAQTLSMVLPQGQTSRNTTAFSDFEYLGTIAAIYGANGSGKSNFIKAFEFFKTFINESAKKYSQGDKIDVTPFLFHPTSPHEPSEFAISFIHRGYFFEYGFELDTTKIHKEYLYATPQNGDKQEWLLRENNIIRIGDMVTGTTEQKQLWKDTTLDNMLFLSVAIQKNSHDFYLAGEWFKKNINVISSGIMPFTLEQATKSEEEKLKIMGFLKQCDVAFYDFETKEVSLDEEFLKKILSLFPDELKKNLPDTTGATRTEILLKYSVNGSEYILPFESESEGTKQLFHLSGIIIDILKHGCIFIFDELHRSLHPKAFEFVIKLFQDEKTNPNNAQLIFTSHDTHPMKFLSKSDVWIAHKNTDSKQTELYSISDFKNVPDTIDIQKEYLDDIFGGLPNIAG